MWWYRKGTSQYAPPSPSSAIGTEASCGCQDDTAADRKAIQKVINQVVAYPLKDFDGKMKTINWAKVPPIPGPKSDGGGETKWVVPEKFFDQFPDILANVPPLPGEEAMYSNFRALMDVAAKNPLALREPRPVIIFQSFGDSAVNLQFSVWTARDNYLDLRNSIAEDIKEAFDRERIDIPYPHRAIVTVPARGSA